MPSPQLTCTYSSGVFINDPIDLATLSVFYDEIWLPFRVSFPDTPFQYPRLSRFEREWYLLVESGILRRMTILMVSPRWDATIKEVLRLAPHLRKDDEQLSLVLHACAAIKPGAELFVSKQNDLSTSRLAPFLLRSFFSIRLPQLVGLTAEQVLDLRRELKDNKEAFSHYINELTDDVEARVKGGDTEWEAASKTLERKVLGQYAEFHRQISAGRFRKFLDVSGAALRVAVAPWSLERYGELAIQVGQALGATTPTNQERAFQFLATIEKRLDARLT